MICRWAQELLGYHFTVLHRSQSMMRDVDALSRRFGPLIVQHINTADILHDIDNSNRQQAYTFNNTLPRNATKIPMVETKPSLSLPVFTKDTIARGSIATPDNVAKNMNTDNKHMVMYLSSVPINVVSRTTLGVLPPSNQTSGVPDDIVDITDNLSTHWLCINDVCGSILAWVNSHMDGVSYWSVSHTFFTQELSLLFDILHTEETYDIVNRGEFFAYLTQSHQLLGIAGFDSMFIPYLCGSSIEWITSMVHCITHMIENNSNFYLATLWIPTAFIPQNISIIIAHLNCPWGFTISTYNSSSSGDCISAKRACITFMQETNTHEDCTTMDASNSATGYGTHINEVYNIEMDCCTITLPDDAVIHRSTAVARDRLMPKVAATVNSCSNSYAQGLILHPDYPASEPTLMQQGEVFGKRFGVPFRNNEGRWLARPIF